MRLLRTVFLLVFITAVVFNVYSQFDHTHTTKIWQTRDIDVIRSLYLDSNGFPSREVFKDKWGLTQKNTRFHAVPLFRVSYLLTDVSDTGGKLLVKETAIPVQTDFYVEYTKTYQSQNICKPVWDARVYEDDNKVIVGGYSSKFNERPVAFINQSGKFEATVSETLSKEFPVLSLPAKNLVFDPFEWKLLYTSPNKEENVLEISKDFMPVRIADKNMNLVKNSEFYTKFENGIVSCFIKNGGGVLKLAQCDHNSPIVDVISGYQPELVKGCVQPQNGKVVTVVYKGEFGKSVSFYENMLIADIEKNDQIPENKHKIAIDGHFSEWRSIQGVDDPEGDYVSYLYPNPDTDILEFKIAHDDQYLYFYSRLAGSHGRTGPNGRYYWYTYIDIDADPNTGYPPTRDDNCYFGIAIGDDCEAQFEFTGNSFIKTFFGFTGAGTEQNALDSKLVLGPSYYSPNAPDGSKRDRYKIEYVNREGKRFITHDNTPGTSQDIIMALSADGSEMEMRVELKGFLTDKNGEYLVKKGNVINIAVGAEGASDHYNSDKWGADSSPVIYGYEID